MNDDHTKAPDDTTTDTLQRSADLTAEMLAASYLSHKSGPESAGEHVETDSPEQEPIAAVPNASGDWLPPCDRTHTADPHAGMERLSKTQQADAELLDDGSIRLIPVSEPPSQ